MGRVNVKERKENFENYLLKGTFYGIDGSNNRCIIVNGKAKKFVVDANGNRVERGLKDEYVILSMPEGVRVYIGKNGRIDILQTKAYQLYNAIESLAKRMASEACPNKELSDFVLRNEKGLYIHVDGGVCDEFDCTTHHYEYGPFISIAMGDNAQLKLSQTSYKINKVTGCNCDNLDGYREDLNSEDERIIDALFYRGFKGLYLDLGALIDNNNLSEEDIFPIPATTKNQ